MPADAKRGQCVQRALFALLLLNCTLIVAQVLLYPPLLAQPGSTLYILEPLVLLIVYAGLMWTFTRRATQDRQAALRVGTLLGLLGGVLWIVNLAAETFLNGAGVATTAPFLLGGFALWSGAGFVAARRAGSLLLGILAAVWAGMITVLLTVTFGFILGLVALPRLVQLIADNPDFLRSGWPDQQAFALANQFDSGFSHLLGALLISTAVGAIGAGVGRLTGRNRSAAH